MCRDFTQRITSATTSSGMSWGSTARPPRRASVSAIPRPLTAVMLAATSGIVVPVPSGLLRSTSSRDATPERAGTMKTSSYVRSQSGRRSWRKRTSKQGYRPNDGAESSQRGGPLDRADPAEPGDRIVVTRLEELPDHVLDVGER